MQAISNYIETLKDDAGFNGSTAERQRGLTYLQMMIADKEMEIAQLLRDEKLKAIAGEVAASEFAKALDDAESKVGTAVPVPVAVPEFAG
jgi:hypothetical protein